MALLAQVPILLTVRKDLPAKDLKEFVAFAKANQGKMQFGSAGAGSATHLGCVLLNYLMGTNIVHIPFKGTVPAVASVLSGDTALAFGTIPGVAAHARAGKLTMLGASFGKRFSQIPEVPAIAETLPGFDMGFYTALLAPARTPKEIIDKLAAEVAKAHAQPKTREIFAASAAEPGSMTPAQLKAYLASEACTETQAVFSAFLGRVAAIQIGITRGWTAPDGRLSAEDVADHLPEILDTTGLLVPRTLYDEMGYVTSPEAPTP